MAAMAENRVIGKNNTLPWSLKEDMIRFKELTMGWPCIMGRKTWESLPKHPLPGRPNIVISRSITAIPEAQVFSSLDEAVKTLNCQKVFICGGASIYREALAIADKIELTQIHNHYEGDVFFPEIDPAVWEKTASADFDGFSFIGYSRKTRR